MCWKGLRGEKDAEPACAAWCGGEDGAACAGREKTCRDGEARRALSLIALEAWKGLGVEAAAWKAAVKYARKWRG